jgi:hypothetical protein
MFTDIKKKKKNIKFRKSIGSEGWRQSSIWQEKVTNAYEYPAGNIQEARNVLHIGT